MVSIGKETIIYRIIQHILVPFLLSKLMNLIGIPNEDTIYALWMGHVSLPWIPCVRRGAT